MKKLYLALFFLCIISQVTAHVRIIGKVTAANNEKITYRVEVKRPHSNALVTATFYQSDFNLLVDFKGEVLLIISSDGYKTYQTQIKLQSSVYKLGKITLNKEAVQQKEVEVKTKSITATDSVRQYQKLEQKRNERQQY